MRKITDIYSEYKIMPNLIMHQLRVTAVAEQICKSLDIEVDKESIIKACLLHDMGNVIKFDMVQTKSIFGLSDSEIENIKKIQDEFIQKYSHDEEKANVEIARELDVSETVVQFISGNGFNNLCIIKDNTDWGSKILQYSDLRVGPKGVLSYDERMDDGKKRYANHKNYVEEEERNKIVNCGRDIEKQIFAHSNIKQEYITDESVKEMIEELKNFEI